VPLGSVDAGFLVDVDALAAAAADPRAKVLLLCNPHHPTGRVLSRPELSAVADIAACCELVVVSDEVHADCYSTAVATSRSPPCPQMLPHRR